MLIKLIERIKWKKIKASTGKSLSDSIIKHIKLLPFGNILDSKQNNKNRKRMNKVLPVLLVALGAREES